MKSRKALYFLTFHSTAYISFHFHMASHIGTISVIYLVNSAFFITLFSKIPLNIPAYTTLRVSKITNASQENLNNLDNDTIRKETVKNDGPKVGRNDPCPCGSGKKYKNCCGK